MEPFIFVGIVSLIVIAFGFYSLGRRHERIAWNELIEEGKIPRPRTRNGVPEV